MPEASSVSGTGITTASTRTLRVTVPPTSRVMVRLITLVSSRSGRLEHRARGPSCLARVKREHFARLAKKLAMPPVRRRRLCSPRSYDGLDKPLVTGLRAVGSCIGAPPGQPPCVPGSPVCPPAEGLLGDGPICVANAGASHRRGGLLRPEDSSVDCGGQGVGPKATLRCP